MPIFEALFDKPLDECEYYHISFSLNAVNQGCCCVKADSESEAKKKSKKLGIYPESDDVLYLPVPEPTLELDRLYTKKEMLSMNNMKKVEW